VLWVRWGESRPFGGTPEHGRHNGCIHRHTGMLSESRCGRPPWQACREASLIACWAKAAVAVGIDAEGYPAYASHHLRPGPDPLRGGVGILAPQSYRRVGPRVLVPSVSAMLRHRPRRYRLGVHPSFRK